jgi:hypothetical protein
LVKNANRAFTALALANIYPARGRLTGELRPLWANLGGKSRNRPERAMKTG